MKRGAKPSSYFNLNLNSKLNLNPSPFLKPKLSLGLDGKCGQASSWLLLSICSVLQAALLFTSSALASPGAQARDAKIEPTLQSPLGDTADPETKTANAYFAAGHPMYLQSRFETLKGVVSVRTGEIVYHPETSGDTATAAADSVISASNSGSGPPFETGGEVKAPLDLKASTASAKGVEVEFDPDQLTFGELFQVFVREVRPEQKDGQFDAIGPEYQLLWLFQNEDERKQGAQVLEQVRKGKIFRDPASLDRPWLQVLHFTAAPESEQNIHKRMPVSFWFKNFLSRREAYLNGLWGRKREFVIRPEIIP